MIIRLLIIGFYLMASKRSIFSVLIIMVLCCSRAYSQDISIQEGNSAQKSHFEQAIIGLYASNARKLTFDMGYYYVMKKQNQVDMSSIFGPTVSASISTNSIAASLGLGKVSNVSMFGAYGAQVDYSFMRRWEDDDETVDYSGVEFKFSLMVFVAKASFMSSLNGSERLNYLSIGVGF